MSRFVFARVVRRELNGSEYTKNILINRDFIVYLDMNAHELHFHDGSFERVEDEIWGVVVGMILAPNEVEE